jgi:hypothetical protein
MAEDFGSGAFPEYVSMNVGTHACVIAIYGNDVGSALFVRRSGDAIIEVGLHSLHPVYCAIFIAYSVQRELLTARLNIKRKQWRE